jgi:actin related protein 2/3 complex subunit 1A/1B
VDWHPETNRIISSSQDRNILIWNWEASKKQWIPQYVNLKVKVSVLDVKWSAMGDKFVATTGTKLVSTGYYDSELKFWTCKSSKEHRSSVTCARFDSTGCFVLSGSTDMRAIITSSYIPSVDDSKSLTNLPFEKVSMYLKFR